jgi:hypothetical protein
MDSDSVLKEAAGGGGAKMENKGGDGAKALRAVAHGCEGAAATSDGRLLLAVAAASMVEVRV